MSKKKKIFSGAGVLIFKNDCLILFREQKNKNYTEPGGKFDKKHQSLEDTAMEELFEETCCLFSYVNEDRNDFFLDMEYKGGYFYRFYVMNLVDDRTFENFKTIYQENLKRLITIHAEKHYLETDNITFVKIEELSRTLGNRNRVKDVYNNNIKIRDRLVMCLITLFNNIDAIHPLDVEVKNDEIDRDKIKTLRLVKRT